MSLKRKLEGEIFLSRQNNETLEEGNDSSCNFLDKSSTTTTRTTTSAAAAAVICRVRAKKVKLKRQKANVSKREKNLVFYQIFFQSDTNILI